MKIFLSAIETNPEAFRKVVDLGYRPTWNLMSYRYVKGKDDFYWYACDHSEEVLIDSGAHSFQSGARADFDVYTKEYGEWIKTHDNSKVLGFFEMDIEGIVGLEKVNKWREYLNSCSSKIIPVWHPVRGVDEFKRLCKEVRGRSNIIAIGGFKNGDAYDDQFGMFIRYAWDNGVKIHCLGGTRKSIIDRYPFDFVDSSSWKQETIYGRMQGTSRKLPKGVSMNKFMPHSYIQWMGIQEKYFNKWRRATSEYNRD